MKTLVIVICIDIVLHDLIALKKTINFVYHANHIYYIANLIIEHRNEKYVGLSKI